MYTFTKEERLCNKKLIDGLFHSSSSFLCYPFKVSWQSVSEPQPYPVQILISVSKKRFKHAVDRNLIKRRMRESYPKQKQAHLYDKLKLEDVNIVLSLGYIGKEVVPYDFMEKKMLKLLTQLCDKVIK